MAKTILAEGVGFEPTLRFPVNTLSKRAPSATRPPLHCVTMKVQRLTPRRGHYSRRDRSDKALSHNPIRRWISMCWLFPVGRSWALPDGVDPLPSGRTDHIVRPN